MDYARILEEINREVQPQFRKGRVASYIPALKSVPPRKFGMAVCTTDGAEHTFGDSDEPFSIQSISKVFTLVLALERLGARLWERVGREPSGTAFNSLVLLEHEHGIPRNPFINAGALVVTDCVVDSDAKAVESIRALARRLARNDRVDYDEEVARSERATGHLNTAIAYFLKSHGNLKAEVDAVLGTYFYQCSLGMSCLDLARAFLPLANDGAFVGEGGRFLAKRRVKRINALMMTCGLYDGVGNFAFRVGMPAKSGVGGGIVGVIPRVLSICVWSPRLDKTGNSLVGTKALELFTTKTRMSVF
ncbi:MAG: glutaminase [Alphaproteobacteria bacterium]|nr:glutaminase [Alphaproteobacteria bacterium]